MPLEAMFDFTEPGATWRTDMLNGLSSINKTSLILLTAAFAAAYKPFHGVDLTKFSIHVKRTKKKSNSVHFSYDWTNVNNGPWATLGHERYNSFANAKYGKCIDIKYLLDTVHGFFHQRPYCKGKQKLARTSWSYLRCTWRDKSCIIHYNVNLAFLIDNMFQSILNTFITCNIKRNLFNSLVFKIGNGFNLPRTGIDFALLTCKFFTPCKYPSR